MSFQEDLYEFLDIEQGFAITAILHSADEEYVITGIMSEEYVEIDSGMAGVYGSKPVFECAEEDIREVEYGNLLTVHNKKYRIIEIKPDGRGFATLVLERQIMHVRGKIRRAFVELLQGKTIVGTKVYDSRLYTMEFTSLPGIIVFSPNEEVSTNTITPPRCQERNVKIVVECYAKATNQVNIIVDDIALEIEKLVSKSLVLKKLCKDCRLAINRY